MSISEIKWRNINCFQKQWHSDYYDDGLIVDDENQSYSELDKIAQPKRSRTKVIMTPLAIMLLSEYQLIRTRAESLTQVG